MAPGWYKPFHAWAVGNVERATRMISNLPPDSAVPGSVFRDLFVPAIQAFFRSIAFTPAHSSNGLQDTLRLLNLLFMYGYDSGIHNAIAEGLATVELDVWLPVVPQLMARLFSSSSNVKRIIHTVLNDLGVSLPLLLI